jgi:hypothetical protein
MRRSAKTEPVEHGNRIVAREGAASWPSVPPRHMLTPYFPFIVNDFA